MSADPETGGVPHPDENLHHPAKKPGTVPPGKDVPVSGEPRDTDEHGSPERDTLNPGRPR